MKSSIMSWAEHVSSMGDEKKVYKDLVGKPQGKRSLGRSRRRWEDGIRMEVTEIGWEDVKCVQLVQDRGQWRAEMDAVMNHGVS
jgi:hypothetical protein